MLDTLKTLLEDQIKDLFYAENQLVKALPRMARKATDTSLRKAFENHLAETRQQVKRLAQAAELLEIKPGGKTCKAMRGLIEEGKEVLDSDGEPAVIDAALIAAAQRVEHYEIAAYTSAQAMAELLGEKKIVKMLMDTLNEERAADGSLGDINAREVLPAALQSIDDEDEPAASASRRPTRS